MHDDELSLTQEEIAAGWHFCPEFDGALIRPGMWEFDECCLCFDPINDVQAAASGITIRS